MARKDLPLGIDRFSKIRAEGSNYYYVDKTDFIARLAMKEGHYFLSRPRRFGKTMLVDTLKNLFEGKKELFKGLAIYDKWDWTVKYPVVRLELGGAGITNPEKLNENVMVQLEEIEGQEGVSTTAKTSEARFSQVIKALHREKKQPVVVLVDEYDKPINNALDMIGSEEVARANRSYLSDLYSTIKQCNEHIHFTFLTGVSKFAHAGIFTGINNLTDITLEPEFSSICGYTDHELDTVFAKEIRELDREKIKEWYNGYNWCGKENVYNPFGILQLFRTRKFRSWWFPTGTPSFLIEELKKFGGIDTLRLAGMSAGEELLSSFDIGNMEVPALLFQTGYLTIAREEEDQDQTLYLLDYPNREVRQSLFRGLLRTLAPKAQVSKQAKQLHDALLSANLDAVKVQLHAAFADIPHDFYRNTKLAGYEGHYASVVYFCLMGTGLPVQAESSTNLGNIDMTVETDTAIYVFEFKVLKGSVKRGAALRQIRKRGYAEKFLGRGVPVYLVGMEFSPKDRNIKYLDIEPLRGRRATARKKGGQAKRTQKKTARKKRTRKKGARKKGARAKRSRKKRTRKKGARKKGARAKRTRKKRTRKKGARKKGARAKRTRKKTTRKKPTRKKSGRKKTTRKKRSPRR